MTHRHYGDPSNPDIVIGPNGEIGRVEYPPSDRVPCPGCGDCAECDPEIAEAVAAGMRIYNREVQARESAALAKRLEAGPV